MKKTLLCFLLLFSNFFYAQITSISICAGESFNLTSLKTAFIGNLNPDETNVSYFLSEEDALNNNNVIADPTVYNGYPGVTTKIYARIDHNGVITSNYINFRVNYPLVLHTTVEPISCAKPTARITLFADGGTGPYLYSSDNGSTYTSNRFFYDLPVGTYSFNTKDALGCITSKSVTIENPAPLTITSRKNDVTCSGKANGVVWIQASGGTIPYNYYLINSAGKTVNTSLDSESNSIGFTGLTPDTYTIKVSDNYSCSTQTAQIEITEPAPLTMSTVLSSNTCGANSGSITVLAVGGTPPYIYNIDNNPFQTSNIFTNVGAGAHVIYVTDSNKCLITLITEKVEMTEAPTGILTVKDLVCHGTKEGEITINATGGQAPYQYSIGEGFQSNNTFSNLAEGEYTVTVQDAKGCSSSYTTQVLGSILMSTKIKITNSTTTNDDNGKITIVPLTGVGPFSFALTDDSGLEIRPFQKTNVFADLKSGVYGYQMKDGLGCVFSETNISVLNTPAPLNTSNVVVPMTCDTQAQIIVTANGGTSPYVYSINGGAFQSNNTFSNLTPGSYTITVKDAANTISDASSVLVTSPIPITITAANTPLACWGEKTTLTVIATGGKAPYQYSINNNPSTSSNVFANLKAENYTIKVTDAGGCINTLPYTITEPSLVDADLVIDGNTISLLNVKGGTGSYFYSIDDGTFQTNNIFTNVTPGLHHVRLKDSNNCEPGSFWAEITGPITATIAITKDIDCMSNAEIVTAASGGTAPYTYSINGVSFQSANVFSNLTEGTYSITVKDANGAVTTTNSITIAPISFPTLAFTQTNVSCSQSTDGTIIVSAAGGKAPFLYALDNSPFFPTNVFTNLVAGYYNVTVKDANGCLSSSYVVITEPTPITPTVNVKNSSTVGVNDGQITVIANGGFAPYTYALTIDGTPSSIFQPSNIFDGLQAGSYSVQVKDANGCIAMQAVSIIDGPPALIATAAATQITCTNPNGIISVTATGGTLPYTYSFDNGVTYSASNTYNGFPGTYLIKVKDAENSQASTTITLIAPAPVVATAILAKAIDCTSNGVITVSAAGGQGAYLYSFDNGNTYSSNNTFSDAVAGVYSIIVKDSYGCISNTQTITVDPLVPLVATATITKEVDCINGAFRVDVTGGKSPYLYSINNEPYAASVPLFYKQAGTYTINVKDNTNCIATTVITLKPYTPVSATTIVTNATCFGTANGSIRVNASGGVTPYTYSLDGTNYQTSNIFNNVVAKTYTIRIKDSRGCTINATAIVTQPTSLVATSTIKSVTCKGFNNGSVTLTASGGKSPYTYSRDGASYSSNPNFIALTAGIYTFFVKDANNCIVTNNIAVTEPATLQLITDIKTLNNDGSIGALIQLDAAGGTAPYLYSVKNQVTGVEYGKNVPYKRYSGMPAGLYTISVIDANGCQETKSNIDITLNNPIVLNAVKAPISCIANASLSVTASGGVAPYLYSYDSGNTYTSNNPGRTNLTPGTYSILLKDAIGNEAQTHYIVKAYTPVKTIATVTYETSNGHLDGVITMSSSNGVAPYTYKVKNATTNQLIFDYSASVGYVGLPEGTYSITAKDANGCESASVDATIVLPAPIFITISNVTPITCENPGESLYINASGGVAPYLYSFNLGQTYTTINGVANLKSGLNYVFYVKDAIGNTSWISYKVKTYVPLAINLTKTNIFCNGSQDGTITATASGGTAPYTYSLGTVFSSSNVFNNLSPGQYNVTAKDAAGCTTVSSITILQPSRLSASTSVVNPSSSYNSDGRIAVNASGGVQPYTYSLRRSNGIVLVPSQTANLFANLASGSYVVEVRDALGCTFLQQGISIIAPPALVATASVNPLTCSTNGVITVTATGGTAPYSYSFNNGTTYMASNVFTTAIPGSYNIIVRDAQNSITSLFATIDPVIPVQLIATITSPVTCSQNGTITANTSGGRAPFVYSLNGGPFQSSNSFVVNAGTHIITVRDNNDCTAVVAIQLEQPQPIIADLNIENQTATITASGGTGNFQYAISPNLNVFSSNNTFTNLEAGEYTAIVQDANGCYVMLNFVINPPAPLAEGKQEALVVDVKPGSTLADLVVEGQNIKWYSAPSPSQTKTSKSTAETPLPLTTVLVDGTTYYASQTINGIESKERLAVTAKVNGSLSAPDFNLTSFQFYPNPVIDILNIENNSTIDDVEIIDISGKSVVFKRINDLHSEIDLSNLSSGVYILKVKSENKQKTIKFIKK